LVSSLHNRQNGRAFRVSAILEINAVETGRPKLTYSPENLKRISGSFESEDPREVLTWALAEFDDEIAIATGFGAEGMALIDMAAKIALRVKVFYLDTGLLFPETYELRDRVERKYGLKIESFQPELSVSQQALEYGDELWKRDPRPAASCAKSNRLRKLLAD